jgi:hypothetical protein
MKPQRKQPEIHDQALQLAIDELVELCRHTRHGEVRCRVKLGLHGEVTDFEVRAGELDIDRIMTEPPHRVVEHDKLRRR